MTRFYVRRRPGVRETAGALAVALGAGGLCYYLVRMLLAREMVESRAPLHAAGEPERRMPAGREGAGG